MTVPENIRKGLVKLAILVFLLDVAAARAQVVFPIPPANSPEEKDYNTDLVLDSVVNRIVWNTGGIVCVNDGFVSVDTLTANKVQNVSEDSVTVGKFLKKNQKKISSQEFWGVTTSFGQRQRFYDGKMYLVWETPSPYVYRIDNSFRSGFYYSETLLSPIVPLTRRNVDKAALSDGSKDILYDFIRNSGLGESNYDRSNQDVAIGITVDVVNVLFQVMLICLDAGGSNHSHDGGKQVKKETGRRR